LGVSSDLAHRTVENRVFPMSPVEYAAVEVAYETDYYGGVTQ
jgi:hypothetical protein